MVLYVECLCEKYWVVSVYLFMLLVKNSGKNIGVFWIYCCIGILLKLSLVCIGYELEWFFFYRWFDYFVVLERLMIKVFDSFIC